MRTEQGEVRAVQGPGKAGAEQGAASASAPEAAPGGQVCVEGTRQAVSRSPRARVVTVVRARSRRHWELRAFGATFGHRFSLKREAVAVADAINVRVWWVCAIGRCQPSWTMVRSWARDQGVREL